MVMLAALSEPFEQAGRGQVKIGSKRSILTRAPMGYSRALPADGERALRPPCLQTNGPIPEWKTEFDPDRANHPYQIKIKPIERHGSCLGHF